MPIPRVNLVTGAVHDITAGLRKNLASWGGANSAEMKAAAAVLKKQIRRELSVRGGGVPSSPGEPPRKQQGKLAGSVGDGVVGATRRVGTLHFTAVFFEEGVGASISRPSPKHHGRKKRSGNLTIAPRPFLQRALDQSLGEMGDVFAQVSSDHVAEVAK